MAKSHGTPGKYQDGCRCDVCTDANTERTEASRLKRLGHEPLVHNASTFRNWNCRCPVCSAANLARQIGLRKAAGQGRNRRKEWTSAELDYATEMKDSRRYKRTALEAALHLGRSVPAVNRIRSLARVNSESSPAAPGRP